MTGSWDCSGHRCRPVTEHTGKNDAPEAFPTRWPLSVCRTCGRPAVWPFCEHRDGSGGWFVTIVVRGKVPERERVIPPVQ